MPFTPLHMGPALLLKAGVERRFSLFAFGCAQILMDIEPLLGLIRHAPILHGRTHTLAWALPIGLGAALRRCCSNQGTIPQFGDLIS